MPTDDTRIVGGNFTTIQDHPHQVSIERLSSHHCGGTIVSPKYIVTAAHCLYKQKAVSFQVRVGTSIRGFEGKVHKAADIKHYQKYSPSKLDVDVGVITLQEPITFNENAKAIKIVPLKAEPAEGELLTATGWGMSNREQLATVLQVVEVPVVSRQRCIKAYGKNRITESMFCAGVARKGPCNGDSGGPLINKKRELVGIVSWGRGCGTSFPAVIANVASPLVHGFITNNTQGVTPDNVA